MHSQHYATVKEKKNIDHVKDKGIWKTVVPDKKISKIDVFANFIKLMTMCNGCSGFCFILGD